MEKKIASALISVFYKDGLEALVRQLHAQGTTIYSTGGTQQFIEGLGLPVVPVETLTSYPSILGGRVKTLHPLVFGGILGRRYLDSDRAEMQQYGIPELDLVVVDLYPFQETLKQTSEEALIIEKIDIGGPSMIRAAAKNFRDVAVLASKDDYAGLVAQLQAQGGALTLEQRKEYAAKAFRVVAEYDNAIDHYFNPGAAIAPGFGNAPSDTGRSTPLRYGENPHQQATFFGDLSSVFTQLHGKELSYNNLVDVDAAIELIRDLSSQPPSLREGGAATDSIPLPLRKGQGDGSVSFAIIKHTNVCGVAQRPDVFSAWTYALAGDPESAFGGVLVTNGKIDKATADAINEIFFEVLIAPAFSPEALETLQSKKNRILLQYNETAELPEQQFKGVLNGTLTQQKDRGNFDKWEEAGGRSSTEGERADMAFANLVCKHLKSNAIALVKDRQLIGKGCGQTSRIDALRQALEKARQFNFVLEGAVLASDAFFPFNDCVQLGHEAGINAFIQPGGSIRDKDSIAYCQEKGLALVMTGQRHFKH
ncbi:bifunctional phosphoribosylaminoimidazolecarboxamide formyltransferase/IMP cyclohydrolase [Flaviaesturariibacter aridisoli]|uniref:Bifunctional purine biosynthesis protein PurH n=1 Tax=Flaviaesturariibacter aridisoli TaxID=2545761 RepID=A0A4R4E040_9BACT|nr:bifunctional phosphoribosylaminoimidazolecarboxamide formyltransferase/IMP cyclohydrolase [Flaviaesturariibacter aridisoli]TCZ67215.1 bifunctional phosphoribosylaminoimidazolecarboxamide formyltransferase/IMP cyclohydrolase [Flaviaesturariibacter aridisoli]